MRSLLSIAKYTIIEQLRNRLYLIIMFFGGIVLGLSVLLAALAPGQKVRVIFDFGLLTLEMFGLIAAVFGAVTLVLQEMETKTLYLLLTRPLGRSLYITGRFVGLITAITLTMVGMSLVHIVTMVIDIHHFKQFTEGWNFWSVYPIMVLMSLGKMVVITSVAVFFSLFATSAVSALVFTLFFWISGHFSFELQFMIGKTFQGIAYTIAKWGAWIFPNFQYFNFRDTFQISQFPGFSFIGWSILYGFAYAGFFLAVSALLFRRKEF